MEYPGKILTIQGKKFLIKVETSSASFDYLKYDELRNDIWGFPEDTLPGARNMMCENFLHEGSSLFIAVYADDASGRIHEDKAHLVGFSYGFVGVRDKTVCFKSLDNLWFYSQYTGVLPEFQGFGLGVIIKEFQKEVLTGVFGIYTVTCTYDPLTAVNAARNIHHFGMDVLEYRAATYGEYGGFLNRLDVPTDRFFMSWDLRKDFRRPSAGKERVEGKGFPVLQVREARVSGKSGPVDLEIVEGVCLNPAGETFLVRIPRDFYVMLRETDIDNPEIRNIPLEWRMKTREAFQHFFAAGYKIADFLSIKDRTRRNFYVLRMDPSPDG